MATNPVTAIGGTATSASTSNAQAASNAFGLGFDSLLKIILTQLTYQDPLKPMENFEFVSQLAQFSQIQQGQVMSDYLGQLVSAQATAQATGLLGRKVDIASGTSGSAALIGTVTAVSFSSGSPEITIKTSDGQTIANIALTAVNQIREGS